jgi:hypothetical protein
METIENKNHQSHGVDFLNGKNMETNKGGSPTIQRDKAGRVELSDDSEIDCLLVGHEEEDAIELLSYNLDKMLMDAIKIELEKIGHSFESNELFLEFCKTDLDFSIEQRSGHPLNKTIIVNSRIGELIAKFGLDVVINDSFRIEINLRLLN